LCVDISGWFEYSTDCFSLSPESAAEDFAYETRFSHLGVSRGNGGNDLMHDLSSLLGIQIAKGDL
jgi:hypothetical protein